MYFTHCLNTDLILFDDVQRVALLTGHACQVAADKVKSIEIEKHPNRDEVALVVGISLLVVHTCITADDAGEES